MHTHTHTYIHTYIHTCISHASKNKYADMHINACMHACKCACIHTFMQYTLYTICYTLKIDDTDYTLHTKCYRLCDCILYCADSDTATLHVLSELNATIAKGRTFLLLTARLVSQTLHLKTNSKDPKPVVTLLFPGHRLCGAARCKLFRAECLEDFLWCRVAGKLDGGQVSFGELWIYVLRVC